jgi:hypothetical protein
LIKITSFRIEKEKSEKTKDERKQESIEEPELVECKVDVALKEEREETKIDEAKELEEFTQMEHYDIDGKVNRSILSFGDWEEKSRILKVWSDVCRFTQKEIWNRVTTSLIYRDTGCLRYWEGHIRQDYIDLEESN